MPILTPTTITRPRSRLGTATWLPPATNRTRNLSQQHRMLQAISRQQHPPRRSITLSPATLNNAAQATAPRGPVTSRLPAATKLTVLNHLNSRAAPVGPPSSAAATIVVTRPGIPSVLLMESHASQTTNLSQVFKENR